MDYLKDLNGPQQRVVVSSNQTVVMAKQEKLKTQKELLKKTVKIHLLLEDDELVDFTLEQLWEVMQEVGRLEKKVSF